MCRHCNPGVATKDSEGVARRCLRQEGEIEDHPPVAVLWACTYAGRPFGDESFLREMGDRFGRQWTRGRKRRIPAAEGKSEPIIRSFDCEGQIAVHDVLNGQRIISQFWSLSEIDSTNKGFTGNGDSVFWVCEQAIPSLRSESAVFASSIPTGMVARGTWGGSSPM